MKGRWKHLVEKPYPTMPRRIGEVLVAIVAYGLLALLIEDFGFWNVVLLTFVPTFPVNFSF